MTVTLSLLPSNNGESVLRVGTFNYHLTSTLARRLLAEIEIAIKQGEVFADCADLCDFVDTSIFTVTGEFPLEGVNLFH